MGQHTRYCGDITVHDVVVYLSSLPRIADRNRKTEVLQAFVQGCESLGLKTLAQTNNTIVPCRLAVILGWVGAKIKGPHIQLRQSVIDTQKAHNRPVMAIDGSCFKFADTQNVFLRYSLDGVYYGRSNYANQGSDARQWHMISKILQQELQPWREQGDHILVCLQRDGGWSMKGTDMAQWAIETVTHLRRITQRPILIRHHPKAPVDLGHLLTLPDVRYSIPGSSLQDDIRGAWASVFFNSSSCVASILAGVPVIAQDPDCVAWSVAGHDLNSIESPHMPDRQQWLWDLSAAHWTDEQSQQGLIVQKFQNYF
jgi:hypothetical protein